MSEILNIPLSQVRNLVLKTEISKKTQNPYTYLEINFVSNYSMRIYPSNEQKYILTTLATKSTSIPVKTDDDTELGDFLDKQ